jgi:ABC-type antimicrobial peptide transport system permease subunit
MNWLTKIFHRREDIDREIDEELRFHIETRIGRYIQAGMTPEQARRKALDRFGNFEQIRDTVREIDLGTIESVWQDVRYAARTLAKSPGFTAVALLSLALGIGLNTAIFSAINAVLLRPLPYKEPGRLVHIYQTDDEGERAGLSPANYLDFVKQNQVFEAMAAIGVNYGVLVLVEGGEPEPMRHLRVSSSFFPVLGVQPVLGRTFLPEEDKPGVNVAVLSHDLWRRRFGADPKVLGRDIRLNDASYRVIGVMPEGFRYFGQAWPNASGAIDLWFSYPYDSNPRTNRRMLTLGAIARLKPGVSLEQARNDMRLMAKRLENEYPSENKGYSATAIPVLQNITGGVRLSLLLMLGAVGLVLLIACANVANLQSARAGERRREIAIRIAIGAGRPRLIRQLLTESLLLALTGGAVGLLLALGCTRLLTGILPSNMLRLDEANVDLRVLGFTLVASLLTGILFGLAPAVHGSKAEINNALKDTGRSTSDGRNQNRFRGTLVVVQVGLSLVLLVGAGLMLNSVWRLHRIPMGFNPEHVLTLRCALPKAAPYVTYLGLGPARPGDSEKRRRWALNPEALRFGERVKERIERVPGVERAAAAAPGIPLAGFTYGDSFKLEGQTAPSPQQEQKQFAIYRDITPGYFRTLGIPLLQGRDFNERDAENAPGVAIVNQIMARTFWPSEPSVIGKRILRGEPPRAYQIVGVVDTREFHQVAGVSPYLQNGFVSQMYHPQMQRALPAWSKGANDLYMGVRLSFYFVVRTRANPAELAAAIRNAIREVDQTAPVDQIRTMDEVASAAFSPWRSTMLLLGLFAGLAVLLASVGIYGVISYAATQRTHEIGIRMAMGAGHGDVLLLVMKSGLLLALAGVVIGSGAAYWLTRLIENQLYGVTPTDPATFASVAALLLTVALVACYLPARRAARLDPIAALRCE